MNELCPHGRSSGAYCEPCAEKEYPPPCYGPLPEGVDVEELVAYTSCEVKMSTGHLVSSPTHYTVGGYEAIDVIRAKLTPEEFTGYCKGNVLKYIMRANYKGHHNQDVEKAQWYVSELANHLKSVQCPVVDTED